MLHTSRPIDIVSAVTCFFFSRIGKWKGSWAELGHGDDEIPSAVVGHIISNNLAIHFGFIIHCR